MHPRPPHPGRTPLPRQYYLRDEGLALSWVGTGRCLFSLDFEAEHFKRVTDLLLAAAKKMRDDGCALERPEPPARGAQHTNR